MSATRRKRAMPWPSIPIAVVVAACFACSRADETPRTTGSELPRTPFVDVWPTLSEPRSGDLGTMIEHQEIRVLTSFTLGSYYIDGGRQRGVVYEASHLLEPFARKRLGGDARLLKVTILPVRRDQLLPFLMQGYGDVAFANLTVTSARQRLVDFSKPYLENVRELLVTGPGSPAVEELTDLSGQQVIVREGSSYHESFELLNARLRQMGKPEVEIVHSDPRLQDHDLLEMLDAGLSPMTVVDSHKLRLWSQVFENIRVHDDIPLAENRSIAVAIRKQSPRLKALLDEFVQQNKVGSLVGNVLLERHYGKADWVRPVLRKEPFRRLEGLVPLFRTYGERYGFDWLLLASFAYQESRFDQSARSRRGAVGIMQVLPSTAADPSVAIPGIESLENNIHAGTRYLSVLRDRYFDDPALDPVERTLFTMAAYNAGPGRIRRLRRVAATRGLDPDRWFRNVEHVVAAEVGREPVSYVSNIYKYYLAYRLAWQQIDTPEPHESLGRDRHRSLAAGDGKAGRLESRGS